MSINKEKSTLQAQNDALHLLTVPDQQLKDQREKILFKNKIFLNEAIAQTGTFNSFKF